jgi:hypothetical protein
MNDRTRDDYDLNQLLHPAQAFGHPSEVVNDPDLTLNEKRAILASWASDACTVEAAPDLRSKPGGPPVLFDDIMEALRTLDAQATGHRYRRGAPSPRPAAARAHKSLGSQRRLNSVAKQQHRLVRCGRCRCVGREVGKEYSHAERS